MKFKVNKMVDYELEKALMELVEKLSNNKIVNVKLATAEMFTWTQLGHQMGEIGWD